MNFFDSSLSKMWWHEKIGLFDVTTCSLNDYFIWYKRHAEWRVDHEKKYAYEQAVKNWNGLDWLPMKLAPTWNCIHIEARLDNGRIAEVHYAFDHSGECQPSFEGWFEDRGGSFIECNPVKWKPLRGAT